MRIIDLNSGDMGTAFYAFPLNELHIVIEIASSILLQAKKLINLNGSKTLSYAIGVDTDNSKLADEILRREKEKLPDGVQFYDVDGRILFELRGLSGGIATNRICYLVIK